MDEDIPSIELKLKFQDNNLISFFLYLLISLVISTLIYIYLHIFEKLHKIFWNHREYIDDIY